MGNYKDKNLEERLVSIIKWGIYVSLFCPLVVSHNFFYPYIVPKTIFFRIIVEVVLALYLILALFFPKYRPSFNALSVATFSFILILTICSIFGLDFKRSFWSTYERMTGLFTILHLYGFFLVLSNVFKSRKEWEKVFIISIMVGSVTSWYAANSSKLGGTTGNDSFLGAYLLFNIFFALLFVFKHGLSWLGFFGFASFLIMVSTLWVATTARAVIASLVISFFLLFCLYLFFFKDKKFKIIAVLLPFVLIALTVYSFFYVPEVKEFVDVQLNESMMVRLTSWKMAWEGFLEKPVLGWGPENFNLVYADKFDQDIYLERYRGRKWFDKSHNTILDILVGSGVIGLISYLSLFIIPIFYFFKNKSKTGLIIITLLVSYFIQNLFLFDQIPGYAFFFLTLAFINFVMKKDKVNEEEVQSSPLKIVISFLIIIGTIFLIYFGNVQPALSAINIAKIKETENLEERFKIYKKSLDTLKYNNEINRYTASSFVEQSFQKKEIEDRETLEKFLILLKEETKKNVEDNPLNLRSKIILGRVYVSLYEVTDQKKYFDLAEETFNDCIELSPKYYQSYLLLSSCYLLEGRDEEALKTVKRMEEQGDAWKKVFDDFKLVISIYKRSNEYQKTISLYEEQINKYPENGELWLDFAVYLYNLGDKNNAKKVAQQAIKVRPKLKRTEKDTLEVLLQESL